MSSSTTNPFFWHAILIPWYFLYKFTIFEKIGIIVGLVVGRHWLTHLICLILHTPRFDLVCHGEKQLCRRTEESCLMIGKSIALYLAYAIRKLYAPYAPVYWMCSGYFPWKTDFARTYLFPTEHVTIAEYDVVVTEKTIFRHQQILEFSIEYIPNVKTGSLYEIGQASWQTTRHVWSIGKNEKCPIGVCAEFLIKAGIEIFEKGVIRAYSNPAYG